jgi:mRNA-degrading endonuclease toxin of MazEF toxin-antitoxin module
MAAPKKRGRPASTAKAEKTNKKNKPVVIFLPKVLHSRVRLATMALGTTTSAIVRDLLGDWVISKKKAIQSVVNMEETEEDDVEDSDVEEDTDDESEDEDEDEDEDDD